MIQAEVRAQEEKRQMSRAVEQGSQGAWTKWDLPKQKIAWVELWRLEPYRISYLLQSVVPASSVVREGLWCTYYPGASVNPRTARWRHNKVLPCLADTLERERRKKSLHNLYQRGSQSLLYQKSKVHLLQAASSW